MPDEVVSVRDRVGVEVLDSKVRVGCSAYEATTLVNVFNNNNVFNRQLNLKRDRGDGVPSMNIPLVIAHFARTTGSSVSLLITSLRSAQSSASGRTLLSVNEDVNPETQ
jgi:hypothetical protein